LFSSEQAFAPLAIYKFVGHSTDNCILKKLLHMSCSHQYHSSIFSMRETVFAHPID